MAILKKNVGPKCSFDTLVSQMLREYCGSRQSEEKFTAEVRSKFQKLIIFDFIQEMEEYGFLHPRLTSQDLIAPILLLVNNDWEKLDSIVHSKAEFLKEALKTREENMKKYVDSIPGVERIE